MSNSSSWKIGKTLSGATSSGLSGHGRNGNEEILHIPQTSKTGALPSYGLKSNQDIR